MTVRLRVKVVAGKHEGMARVIREYALDALLKAGVPVESHGRMILLPSP